MPRKKVLDEPEEEAFEWDKSRIIIFFAIVGALLVGGLLFKHFFLDTQISPSQLSSSQHSVQGASSPPQDSSSQLPTVQGIRQGAQQEIQTLQKQASQISVQDIASSSPQVQQVLKQLQQLPNLPGNVAKQTCMNLCNNL